VHLFISLLLTGSIISKCSLKMSGKVREFDHDWRVVATLHLSYVHCLKDKSEDYHSVPQSYTFITKHTRNVLFKMTFFVRPESPILSKFLIFVQILLSYCRLFNLQINKFFIDFQV